MTMNKLYIKTALELTDKEIMEINSASKREFHESFTKSVKDKSSSRLIFLLKDNKGNLLSMGQLISVEPIRFMSKTFSLLGIGGIVSNIKSKGYGKMIMIAIRDYLIKNQKIGVGFCGKHNKPFYEKCGFMVNQDLTQRFVYYNNGKRLTNHHHHDECVIYLDTNDFFLKKVLANPKEEVLLPRPPDW